MVAVKRMFAAIGFSIGVAVGWASPAAAASQTVTLDVPGMSCPTCPITIKRALSKVDGVTQVEVSFPDRTAVVTFDDAQTSVQQLTAATEAAGYPSSVED